MVAPRRLGSSWPRTHAVDGSAWRAQVSAVLLGVLTTAAVQAQAESSVSPWSGALGLVSDKVVRGLSQTQGRATVLMDLNYRTDSGWTAGLGFAPLRVGGEAIKSSTGEVTLSVGRSWQLDADWAAQLGLARYLYPDRRQRAPVYNYNELSASIGWQGRVLAVIAVAPDSYSLYGPGWPQRGHAASVELSGRQRLAGRLTLDAGIGYYKLTAGRDTGYRYGSIGLGWGVGAFQLDLTRTVSNATTPQAGGRWVGSLLWNF